jgi:hypothetical protein
VPPRHVHRTVDNARVGVSPDAVLAEAGVDGMELVRLRAAGVV